MIGKRTMYDALQVSPRASFQVIEAAYKALMCVYHPDRGGDPKKAAEIGAAYNILKDASSRKKYDRKLAKASSTSLQGYRILEKIAEGGFGITYKAQHEQLELPVCIKHALNVSDQDEAILINEAKAIWDLRHYAIPSVRDILKLDDGSLAIVMSYVPGPTLAEILKRNKRLDSEHVCWITERILNALQYMHYNGIVHGDMKPGNVIIQPDRHMVCIVDYGLSLIKPTNTSSSCGYTEYFSPPEQKMGLPLLPESDFYALGMTMVAALGGDIGSKEVPEDVPDSLCAFIRRMIVRDPMSRPRWPEDPTKNTIIDDLKDIRLREFDRSSSFGLEIPGF